MVKVPLTVAPPAITREVGDTVTEPSPAMATTEVVMVSDWPDGTARVRVKLRAAEDSEVHKKDGAAVVNATAALVTLVVSEGMGSYSAEECENDTVAMPSAVVPVIVTVCERVVEEKDTVVLSEVMGPVVAIVTSSAVVGAALRDRVTVRVPSTDRVEAVVSHLAEMEPRAAMVTTTSLGDVYTGLAVPFMVKRMTARPSEAGPTTVKDFSVSPAANVMAVGLKDVNGSVPGKEAIEMVRPMLGGTARPSWTRIAALFSEVRRVERVSRRVAVYNEVPRAEPVMVFSVTMVPLPTTVGTLPTCTTAGLTRSTLKAVSAEVTRLVVTERMRAPLARIQVAPPPKEAPPVKARKPESVV
mmetsp:Transcript_20903/g.48842  ORF Transcript_20903/g.48842 Transcript_20903/m.48842 type:complete len:357 (-) Transcript_20903:5415-6485(-)